MEEISHSGRIVEITPEFTTVEIVSESACNACHAKTLCGVSESTVKAVQLPTRAWDNYKVGDEVNLMLEASMGHKAVWLAYVIPLLVLLAALLTPLFCGVSELVSAITGFGAVAVYYFILWTCRKSLQNEYIFNIKQQ